jgi:hypothetical protein
VRGGRRDERAERKGIQQEVLGRTNRIDSLIRHGPHRKQRVGQFCYCCVCIRYGNIYTESLPGNVRRYIYRQTYVKRFIKYAVDVP